MQVQENSPARSFVAFSTLPTGAAFVHKSDLAKDEPPPVYVRLEDSSSDNLCIRFEHQRKNPTVVYGPDPSEQVLHVTITSLSWRPGAP